MEQIHVQHSTYWSRFVFSRTVERRIWFGSFHTALDMYLGQCITRIVILLSISSSLSSLPIVLIWVLTRFPLPSTMQRSCSTSLVLHPAFPIAFVGGVFLTFAGFLSKRSCSGSSVIVQMNLTHLQLSQSLSSAAKISSILDNICGLDALDKCERWPDQTRS